MEADDEVRVAVLRANTTEPRPVFCAGYDLTSGTGEAHGGYTERGGFAGFTQRARTKPIVAAVDGFAVGGGFEIALACDVVVASPRAAFALAEVKWNLVAAAGGITYPLYLMHQNVGYMIFNRIGGAVPFAFVVIGTTIAMMTMAWLIWRFAERPGQQLLKRALRAMADYPVDFIASLKPERAPMPERRAKPRAAHVFATQSLLTR